MDKLSHRERILTILSGQKPDRFAASFWRHFFHLEHDANGTSEAMLVFQKRFDWDFMKINPRADYHIEGWGFKQEFSRSEFEKHTKQVFPIKTEDDWLNIKPLPLSSLALAEHLKVVSIIRKRSDRELPILMTVFTPLSIAGRMVAEHQTFLDHLHAAPDKVLSAIEAITVTFVKFAEELRNAGADGLFFATTHWASSDMLTWEEYQRFGVPYDLRVIRAAGEDALNLLHVCSTNCYLKQLADIDYPARMINWDSFHPTNPPLDKAYDLLPGKTLVGGVDHNGWLPNSTPGEIAAAIDDIRKKHDSARVIIGPGCAIPPETPMENLRAIRDRL
jgi:uroporphyrinogen decarboxylase